jgi:hypothetical protein
MINAFKQIRLTNTLMSGVNGRLMIGAESDAHLSDLTSASGSLAASIALTGSNLYSLIQAASAGVSSINSASGSVTLVGAGDVSVTTAGQTITISGNTGQLINYATNTNLALTGQAAWNAANTNGINLSGNLQTTGSNLYSYIVGFSGQANTNFATVTNLASTGQQAWLAANTNGINLSGNLALTGQAAWAAANTNSINLSGNLQTTGSNLYNYIHTFSGNSQSFATGINPTGFDTYAVGYPLGAFSSTPRVYCTVEISGNVMYAVNITGRSSNGFFALFSDVVSESGVVLHSFCTINS